MPFASLSRAMLFGLALLLAPPAHAQNARPAAAPSLDKITFGTNWVAEAEHGGFYLAVANGIYKKHGIDAEIRDIRMLRIEELNDLMPAVQQASDPG